MFKKLIYTYFFILFIVQYFTKSSKPQPLKQDTQKEEKQQKIILNNK